MPFGKSKSEAKVKQNSRPKVTPLLSHFCLTFVSTFATVNTPNDGFKRPMDDEKNALEFNAIRMHSSLIAGAKFRKQDRQAATRHQIFKSLKGLLVECFIVMIRAFLSFLRSVL